MSTTALKVVIDTNIFITIIGGNLVLCVSNDILLEYREILEQKTNVIVAENVLNFLLVHPFVEKYEIYYDLKLIADDPDDNKFCDCAFAAGALLMSNDGHFDVLLETGFPQIALMSLSEFSKFYQE